MNIRRKAALRDPGDMPPRLIGRLGLADLITVANGMLGFVAAVVAAVDPSLAARLILLAAMGDGLDGVVARRVGATPIGKYLDSLADVAAFGVAPGLLVVGVARGHWGLSLDALEPRLLLSVGVGAVFLGAVVIRLGFYTAEQSDQSLTLGVPSTLAATILGAAVLARIDSPALIVAATGIFTLLMITRIRYPDLLARDTIIMGAIQGLAVLVPMALGRAFPYALLTLGLAYLVLGPWLYWRDV